MTNNSSSANKAKPKNHKSLKHTVMGAPQLPKPPPERPPREYPQGVPRQAYLSPEAQAFNVKPKGNPNPTWPPMRSTIPPEPDRTDLRRVPFRDWWVLFCIVVLGWFIYAHANGVPSGYSFDTPTIRMHKKSKKKKKGDPAVEKLNKETEIMRKDTMFMDFFLTAIDNWVDKNSDNLLGLLDKFDIDNTGQIDYASFKSALFDLHAPCNILEGHLICRILDKECTGKVTYRLLNDRLINIVHNANSKQKQFPGFDNSKKKLDEPVSVLSTWKDRAYTEDKPLYLNLTLRLIPFENHPDYPCHINSIVNTTITGLGLASLIREKTSASIFLPNIQIYATSDCEESSLLPLGTSLKQKNYVGGSRDDPETLMMFYTYITSYSKCPLLLCDYYMTYHKVTDSKNCTITDNSESSANRQTLLPSKGLL